MTADVLLRNRPFNLDISIDDGNYRSDNIEHGRLVKGFFVELSKGIFRKAYAHWWAYREYVGQHDIPLLYSERNLYSHFAAALDDITPVHLSEWPFKLPIGFDANRRVVDFWCMNKAADSGKALNYFIEVKKTCYSVSTGTREEMAGYAQAVVNDAIDQLTMLKRLKPDWWGDGDVFLAMTVIHGYQAANRGGLHSHDTVLKELARLIDGKLGAQLIASTWTLPEEMEVQWDTGRCRFITIAGIAITKKR